MPQNIILSKHTSNCSFNIRINRQVIHNTVTQILNKKAQLSLTNPRDACEKFSRFM